MVETAAAIGDWRVKRVKCYVSIGSDWTLMSLTELWGQNLQGLYIVWVTNIKDFFFNFNLFQLTMATNITTNGSTWHVVIAAFCIIFRSWSNSIEGPCIMHF